MTVPLVALALDYYRDPLAYRHLAEVERPLPQGFGGLLADFCTALSSVRIAQTAAQLAADPAEMEEAARFFVRHVLLNPAGDYYRHLGLNRDAPQESIRHHYQLLIRMFHPDRVDPSTEVGAFYATRINLAYQTLRDPETRAVYDRGLPDLAAGFNETDPAWFFRPSLPVIAGNRPGRAPRGRVTRGRPRRVGLALVGAGVLAALVLGSGYALIQANRTPTLRLTASGSSETAAPLPSYLAPSARISGSGGRAAVDPLRPLEPAPVDGALSEPARTAIRAVADMPERPAPERLAEVPARVTAAAVEPPNVIATTAATTTVSTDSVTPKLAIDSDQRELDRLRMARVDLARVDPDRIGVGRPELDRVLGPVPPVVGQEDLAKAREPEALVIPTLAAASTSAASGGDVPPPHMIEPQRPAQSTRVSAAPRQAADPTPRRTETAAASPPKAEPVTQPKARLPELPKALPPAPLAKPASRRPEELQAATPEPKRAAAVPTPAAPQQPARSLAGAAERAPSAVASRNSATPEKDAAAVVARLEGAYAAMNADGFAALFTADARVNEGSGRGLIRSKYADLFKRLDGAKLSINNMRWRAMPDGRISGTGAITVGTRHPGEGRYRYAAGRIDFELARDGGGYRIASMIYRMN
jgi:hypothetical protein